MKASVVAFLLLVLIGCSHTAPVKRAPEIVASCFSDGEEQEAMCKTQRTIDDGRIAVTRCIGSDNRLALANLRGKCVEKICVAGSNTECETRGEFAVLQAYAELMRGKLFAEDEYASPNSSGAPVKKSKDKKRKGKRVAAVPAVEAEVDVDPNARLPAEPEKEEPAPAPVVKVPTRSAVPEEPVSMNVVLKPAPVKKARGPSSVKVPPSGFQRVCVAKADTAAPEHLRGKCAIRNCESGRCTYKGRKEMFDWVAANR